MYCHNCGSPNNDGAKFCRNCGTALTVVTAGPVARADKGKSKGKKKSFKAVAVILVVAILASAVAVVGLTVDYKKIALNDFEYYLYLEKKNAEELLGEDFLQLIEQNPSFSAETTMTGSFSGPALNYSYNEEMKQLAGTELKVRTDYNGNDILNIDGDYFYSDGTLVYDLLATFLNGDLVISSETLTDNKSFSFMKSFDSKYSLTEIKEALTRFFVSVYEHFGKFEEYIEVSNVSYDGEKATKIFMYFDYDFIAELTDYVSEYFNNDEVILYVVEKFWETVYAIEGEDLQEELKEDGFDNFKEAWENAVTNVYSDYYWWIEDKVEIEYEVIYNKAGNILSREMILAEVADDIEHKFKNSVSRNSSGDITSTLRVEGQTVMEVSNYNGDFSAMLKADDIEWNLNVGVDRMVNCFVVNVSGRDDRYYCGYDSLTSSSKYDRLNLDLEFYTKFSNYNFKPADDLIDKGKPITAAEIEKIFNEKIEDQFRASFG